MSSVRSGEPGLVEEPDERALRLSTERAAVILGVMSRSARGLITVAGAALLSALPACKEKATALPWQPHGLRVPSLRCELDVPAGWSRQTPMPDHIAELSSSDLRSTIIVGQRVEPELATARERAMTYYRSGLLTAAGSALLADGPLSIEGLKGSAHRLSLRSGPGRVETLILLALPDQPLVEIVARHEESAPAEGVVLALARSLRCTR